VGASGNVFSLSLGKSCPNVRFCLTLTHSGHSFTIRQGEFAHHQEPTFSSAVGGAPEYRRRGAGDTSIRREPPHGVGGIGGAVRVTQAFGGDPRTVWVESAARCG
jgi:hypothetical protein